MSQPGVPPTMDAMRQLVGFRLGLNRRLGERLDWTIERGFFQGLRLPPDNDRYWSMVGPALLGCFELEVQQTLGEWSGTDYDAIINVGAGEGYYMAGLARAFPDIPVIGYETIEDLWPVIRDFADLNDVGDRLELHGFCDADMFHEAVASRRRPLVIMDIEGAEVDLLSSLPTGALAHCDLIIEAHDGKAPNTSSTLSALLDPTHEVTVMREGGRDPGINEFVRRLPSFHRWLLVWEGRSTVCNYLAARARSQL